MPDTLRESPLSPEQQRVDIDATPDLFVEERLVGDVEFSIALCSHTPENMPAVANALREVSTLAIELVGNANNTVDKEQLEQFLTFLLSKSVDKEKAIDYLRRLDENHALPVLLEKFIGTDTQVKLIDVDRDHPEYERAKSGAKPQHEYAQLLTSLAPVDKVIDSLFMAADATADEYTFRDPVLINQLQELAATTDDKKVGVVLGAMHYRVAEALGDPKSPGSNPRAHIIENASGFNKIVEAIRTNESIDDAVVHTELLTHYFTLSGQSSEHSRKTIEHMNSQLVKRVLDRVDEITRSEVPYSDKLHELTLYLSAIADTLSSLH